MLWNFVNVDTLVWRELSTSGQLLPPRAGHSTVSFGKNFFVFGGFSDAQTLYSDLHMLDIGMLFQYRFQHVSGSFHYFVLRF